jgi:arsenate reductase
MSKGTKLWHNPRCSKSRQALQFLREQGIEPVVYEYLKTPPSRDDVSTVLSLLQINPHDLLRTKEQAYQDLNLKGADSESVLAAIETHPVLIERPIVIHGDRAVIARPTDRIKEIL